ncbi:MAG: cation diffusion facilitator family transporter [Firmicutes bacterium]|nr:cation diffusion facilitator family transporter [Bacillota bacterium]MDY5857225.1 cation diffusion facilitator family transporter [Anaerovoracaceae bacterium]
MSTFLFRHFIKNYEDVKDPHVRDGYGKLAGIVGIISNVILCLMKVAVGLIAGSIAIIADGINNLADSASSVITLVGFKLAAMPEDEEHPYGHARYEYLSSLAVSVIIILVGFELGKSSLDKILHPTPLDFSWTIVLVLVIAIAIKVWQALFNVSAGKRINSMTLIATGADSRNDVIATSAVLISLLIGYFFSVQIDGYMGVAVALFIIWSGISLVRETISPLLGEAPDEELVRQIEEIAMSYDGALGIHDLVVHNYGPGKIFASLHIEVDASEDVMVSHDLIDNIEHRLQKDLNINITVHMDPVKMDDPNRAPLSELIRKTIDELPGVLSFHDLRFVAGPTHTNVIFDVVIHHDCTMSEAELQKIFNDRIQEYNPAFFAVIDVDKNYVALK